MVLTWAGLLLGKKVQTWLGMAKLKRNQVFQIGVIIGLFHVIMPLGGMIAGQFLSGALGALAGYIGGALLLVLGIQMIVASFNKSSGRPPRNRSVA
ncbi:hypothetical protein DT075_07545 [Bacillus licheniformis]|nr:hypothetical protein DT075_07545 [Bacillus licheniformis]